MATLRDLGRFVGRLTAGVDEQRLKDAGSRLDAIERIVAALAKKADLKIADVPPPPLKNDDPTASANRASTMRNVERILKGVR